jgi:hypothetical protein
VKPAGTVAARGAATRSAAASTRRHREWGIVDPPLNLFRLPQLIDESGFPYSRYPNTSTRRCTDPVDIEQ